MFRLSGTWALSFALEIGRKVIEGEFEGLLKTMRPTSGLIEIVGAMFADALAQRSEQVTATKKALAKTVAKLAKEIDGVLDRIGETHSAHAAKAYERKIERLEADKLLTQQRLAQIGMPVRAASRNIEFALRFLSSPWKLWTSYNPEQRKHVLKLAF